MSVGEPFKVDLFVVGAMRCGTTSMYHMLKQHPDISMSRVKEPSHFLRKEDYDLLPRMYEKRWWDRSDYRALFEPGAILGEASTHYTYPPFTATAAERIHAHNPDAKLVYLVRHPVERLVSHYNLDVRQRVTTEPLDQATIGQSHYIGVSDYAAQLAILRDRFPAENILVLIAERVRNNKIEAMRQVTSFLDLAPLEQLDTGESHVSSDRQRQMRIPEATRYRIGRSRAWRAFSRVTPKALRHQGGKLLYGRLRPAAQADQVPVAAIEYLARRADALRAMIGDRIEEWDI